MHRPSGSVSLHITPRDIAILVMVYRYDGCLNAQVKRRFWPGVAVHSPYYDRLARLIQGGYLRATRLPSRTGQGSGPSLLTLGPASYPILERAVGLTRAERSHLRHAFVPMFWIHDAACRDVRLDLELACDRHGGVELVDWLGERELKRTPIKVLITGAGSSSPSIPAHHSIELVPDGQFALRLLNGQSKTYWFELDRGTEQSPTRVKAKLEAYLTHLATTGHPVLYVVETHTRREQLTRWVQDVADATHLNPRCVALALRSELTSDTILTIPIWQVVGSASTALLPDVLEAPSTPQNRPQRVSWYEYLFGPGGADG